MRRRFSNAMRWYTSLVNYKTQHVQDLINESRALTLPHSEASSRTMTDGGLQRPTEYLWWRCLLCFGGEVNDDNR